MKADPTRQHGAAANRLDDYQALVKRIRKTVSELTPPGVVVSVISRGDDELVQFPKHRGWHFPQGPFGLYAGYHPGSDAEAIQQLEEARKHSASRLVVPATAFWWLNFYRGFARHLQDHYACVHQDADCAIFDLAPEAMREDPFDDGMEPAEDRLPTAPQWHGSPLEPKLVTVVVPVHNAFDDVRRCVDSVLAHTRHPHQILLIDDASTDERVWPALLDMALRHPVIRLLRHPANLGYTATVNQGCRLAPGDVVLLNSDTIVTEGWLDKLSAVAASRPDVATVTPLSNAAGAFSVPHNNEVNEIPEPLTIDDMGALVEELAPALRPEVPTGNGFCLYIARRALNAAGFFDERHFPRGYGEENDFCMRAKALGFVNLIDDTTFIYHHRAASFQGERNELLAQAGATLRRLHPGYREEVARWLSHDPLDPFREQLKDWLLDSGRRRDTGNKATLLYIVHDGSGGTPLTSLDLAQALGDEFRCLLLKTGLNAWTLQEIRRNEIIPRRRFLFRKPWRLEGDPCAERRAALGEIVKRFNIDLAHVRHLLGNGPSGVNLLKDLGIPVVFSFHDYYTVCPTIQLVDGEGRFCGGECTPGSVECPVASSWFREGIPPLKHRYVHQHREFMSSVLRRCDRFVTTGREARTILCRAFPFLDGPSFSIIEHGRIVQRVKASVAPAAGRPARVVCLGNIDRNKGADLINAVMQLDARHGRRFEFHFLGARSSGFDPELMGGIIHGKYQREELAGRLKDLQASFAMIPSLWAETYCHTLTEAWAAGLPVFASNLGALKERISREGGGWLLDPRDPAGWYHGMVETLDHPEAYARAAGEVERMKFRSVKDMAAEYHELYRACLAGVHAGGGRR